ncbi:MAG: type I DNA topoisomerase [Clostridia bacterium]
MKLVIVESPAKAKTIAKYLGEGYIVDASGGHISDLPQKTLGVDIKHNYEPTYVVTPNKKETIKRLQGKVNNAEVVYLATDPDREGEAISWHLQNVLKLDKEAENRIEFNEITKKAVQSAIIKPRKVNINLVNAQQARRVLDRLVGYKLSPVLCFKIKNNLSAGRVQSAALKIIVDKEREIKAFVAEEYWTLTAFLYKDNKDVIFKGTLTEKKGKKYKISNGEECKQVLVEINKKDFIVKSIKRSKTMSNPQPPFTTSTLQQDVGNKLNLSNKVTMQIAQQLYEGIDLADEGHTALVTYIRTDSVRVSEDAQKAAKEYITNLYGKEYVPTKFNIYKSKKDSQDAHEAIRPVNVERTPESLKGKISNDQYRVYKLIYERFLASQSVSAVFDTLTVMTECMDYGFKSIGKTPVFDGFLRIYGAPIAINKEKSKSKDTISDEDKDEDDESLKIPDLLEGEIVKVDRLKEEQKFTKAPLRYTESTLVKAMEENGIGRPSTYSTILTTLYNRQYTTLLKKYIIPSELGFIVTQYLEKYFDNIVDTEFTAQMEDKLDDIEDKGSDWRKIIDDFYKPFYIKVKEAMDNGEKMHVAPVLSDEVCDKCGALMYIKENKYGKFLACSGYPACKNIKSLKPKAEAVTTDIVCDKCGNPMVEKEGKYGKFLACSNYPECKNIISLKPKAETVITDILCDKCGKPMVEKIGRYGKFLACSGYPDCKNIKRINGEKIKDNEQNDNVDNVDSLNANRNGENLSISINNSNIEKNATKIQNDVKNVNNKQALLDIICDKCGKPMVEKEGRYGKFLACSGYPNCKNIKSLKTLKVKKDIVLCPKCNSPMSIEDAGGENVYKCNNIECGYIMDILSDKI